MSASSAPQSAAANACCGCSEPLSGQSVLDLLIIAAAANVHAASCHNEKYAKIRGRANSDANPDQTYRDGASGRDAKESY